MNLSGSLHCIYFVALKPSYVIGYHMYKLCYQFVMVLYCVICLYTCTSGGDVLDYLKALTSLCVFLITVTSLLLGLTGTLRVNLQALYDSFCLLLLLER